MDKAQKVSSIAAIVLVGFVAAIVFHYVAHYYFALPYPHNTFLFRPDSRFGDFYCVYLPLFLAHVSSGFDPYFITKIGMVFSEKTGSVFLPSGGVYFPFTYLIFYPFALIKNPHLAVGLFLFIYTGMLLVFNRKYLILQNDSPGIAEQNMMIVIILTFMTYPFLIEFERANIEAFVFIFLLMFFYFYSNGKTYRSLFFLSLATSVKLYPGVFFLLFLCDKKYKEVFCALSFIAAITGIALLSFDSGLGSLPILKSNLEWFKNYYVLLDAGLAHSSCLLAGYKVLMHSFLHIPWNVPVANSDRFLAFYSVFAMSIFLLMAAYIWFIEKILWKKFAILVAAMLLLPHVVFNYKLIHLFIPLYLFVNYQPSTKQSSDIFYVIIFSLLLIPNSYVILKNECSLSTFTNPLLLTMLVMFIMAEGFIAAYRENRLPMMRNQLIASGIEPVTARSRIGE